MSTAKKTPTATDFPAFNPSTSFKRVPVQGEDLHACMGLNNCAGQDRYGADGATGFEPNACAGQGFCATTQMHSCHTNNNCANQGGCGLYGSEDELTQPGQNDCRSMGSCATPINAERFITTGGLRGTSVWARARKVFEEAAEKKGPSPDAFPAGPTAKWIKTPPTDGLTYAACGASGMSGGGSCG